jgi:general nucleoside transport system permease protein
VSDVQAPPTGEPGGYAPSPAARLAILQRAGGILLPLITTAIAFLIGGLVVLVSGGDPVQAYKEIFRGSGLSWFFEVGSHQIGLPWSDATVWFPWNVDDIGSTSALNLQQTMLLWIPLALTGLAVAFAFRCGMFNIGGQGQYLAGAITAVAVGGELTGMATLWHVLICVVAATIVGAAYAGIAGLLKATVGAHEVISTIMLNWIAIFVGLYLFGLGGPLQDPNQPSVPVSKDIAENAKLSVFWGDPLLQGLHIGFFVAIAALVVYWITLNRTTLGYEVRAVGFNPEAARYGGISVARNYFLALAISGAFAGLAGAMDVLGWQFRLNTNDITVTSQLAFTGIAVALLGRNTAIGTALGALLFAALYNGTSTRNLDPDIFRPELATNLTTIIQGLVVLFVGADLLILYVWQLRRKLRGKHAGPEPDTREAAA